jgi:hypothetical protein
VDARERKRAYDRDAARRYRARLRNDVAEYSDYLARARVEYRKNAKRRREALRSDPIKYAEHLERERVRGRQNYPKLRANWTERQAAAAREATRRWTERLKKDPAKYRAFAQRRRDANRIRYAANRDTLLSRQRQYLSEHRQVVYARNCEYAAKNREKIRARQHETYTHNLEANRARDRERRRQRYTKDPKAHNEYMKKWRAANPERARADVRLSGHRWRAAAGGDFIRVDDWEALLKKYDRRCAYCGVQGALIEADHRVPLSRGGKNTIENIVPACRRCNRPQADQDGRGIPRLARSAGYWLGEGDEVGNAWRVGGRSRSLPNNSVEGTSERKRSMPFAIAAATTSG